MTSPQETMSFVSPWRQCSLGFPSGNKTHCLPWARWLDVHVYNYVAGQIKPWVNLFQPTCRSIWFFFCFSSKQKIFLGTFDLPFIFLLLFISTILYLPHLLFPPCSPNIAASILLTCISMIILWALNHRPLVFLWIRVLISYLRAMSRDLDASCSTTFLIT